MRTGTLMVVLLFVFAGCERQPSTRVNAQLSYSPPIVPVTISLDTDCQISVKWGTRIVTPIGTFEPSISAKMKPDDPQKLYVIVQRGDEKDAVYELELGSHIEVEPAQLIEGFKYPSPNQIILILPRCKPPPDAQSQEPSVPIPEPPVDHSPTIPKPTPQSSPRLESTPPTQPVPTHPLSIHDFSAHFRPTPGWHFARIIHPHTRVEYQISFWLPEGSPQVSHKKDEIRFRYPERSLLFEFKKSGSLETKWK